MNKINILLVDDHAIVLDGITSILHANKQLNVVGTANNEKSIFAILNSHKVNLVLLDIYLPKPIGLELLKLIIEFDSIINVIVLSANEEEELISTAFRCGAKGYVSKSDNERELIKAIEIVMNGELYLSSNLEKYVSRNFIKKAISGDKYAHYKLLGLSTREIEIVGLICEGFSSKEVAAQLEISARTVESHKNNILEKLGLKNSIELVKYAIKNKIIDL